MKETKSPYSIKKVAVSVLAGVWELLTALATLGWLVIRLPFVMAAAVVILPLALIFPAEEETVLEWPSAEQDE